MPEIAMGSIHRIRMICSRIMHIMHICQGGSGKWESARYGQQRWHYGTAGLTPSKEDNALRHNSPRLPAYH